MNTETTMADLFNSEQFLRTMAMVFTVISGIASIVLTLSKFGLPPWKKITLITTVLVLGLGMGIIFLTRISSLQPNILSKQETNNLSILAGELGDFSAGFTKTDSGLVSRPVRGDVNRVSNYVFAVMHPNGHFDAVYSGDFFPAQIGDIEVRCELIDLGDERVLIVKGQQTEIVDLKSNQSENTFKIRKIPVKTT